MNFDKEKIEYLVGYIEKDEFWAILETDSKDEAIDCFDYQKLEDADQDLAREWKIFKKTIKFTEL